MRRGIDWSNVFTDFEEWSPKKKRHRKWKFITEWGSFGKNWVIQVPCKFIIFSINWIIVVFGLYFKKCVLCNKWISMDLVFSHENAWWNFDINESPNGHGVSTFVALTSLFLLEILPSFIWKCMVDLI